LICFFATRKSYYRHNDCLSYIIQFYFKNQKLYEITLFVLLVKYVAYEKWRKKTEHIEINRLTHCCYIENKCIEVFVLFLFFNILDILCWNESSVELKDEIFIQSFAYDARYINLLNLPIWHSKQNHQIARITHESLKWIIHDREKTNYINFIIKSHFTK